MFLSIIVPVYNVERYLTQCLDSALGCGLEDSEMILVNDGSTDKSGAICAEYAQKHGNISVISQKNGGLSSARNAGIRTSRGDYLLFLDSDDFVVGGPLKKCLAFVLQSRERGTDMIVNDFYRCSEAGKIYEGTGQIEGTKDGGYLREFISSKGCYWNVWRTIYRKRFLLQNGLWFREGFLCEDVDFTTKAFLCGGRLEFIHIPYYCYRRNRRDSIMSVVNFPRVFSVATIISDLMPLLAAKGEQAAVPAMRDRLGLEYMFSSTAIYEVAPKDREKTAGLLADHLSALRPCGGAAAVLYRLSRCFGIRRVAFGLFLLKKARRAVRAYRRPNLS